MHRFEFAPAPERDEDVVLDEDVRLEEESDAAAAPERAERPRKIRRILILCTGLRGGKTPVGAPGSEVRLSREPDFPEDRWAIRVSGGDGAFLGYVPFAKNQSAARLMDAGRRITGQIMGDALRVALYLETEVEEEEEEKA